MEILVLHNSQFEHPISESGVEDYVEEQPVIPTPCRRGSACSGGVVMTTATEVDDKAEGTATVVGTGMVVVVGEGGNMTTEQTSLEHHFAETRKPSVNERRLPVEATGLSIQHVATWFQEERFQNNNEAILESAGRRQGKAFSYPIRPLTPTSNQQESDMSATPLRHRTESVTAIPSYPRNMPNHSIHSPSSITNSSPSHAELLAHSLAAAASNNNNDHEEDFRGFSPEVPQFQMNKVRTLLGSPPQSPFPTSAFSDYGSSQCSSAAYTPAESEVDPFEYDNHSHHSDLHTPEPPPPDNFNLFAAAIAMHSLNHNFVLPDFPPQRLVERRPDRFGSGGSDGNGGIATQPQSALGAPLQDPFAANFAQAMSPPSPSAAEVPYTTLDPMENTLAARRRSPCSSRRQSCMGLEQQRTYPVLRRINTDDANSGRISPYSSCPDTAATIRPRTSSASALLPPPTPPSPEDPVPSQKQQYMQTEHEEMSPPATPQTRVGCFASSIPRHFEDYGGFYGGGPSSGGSIESDAFEFDYCIVARAPPMTAALPSSATISGTGFF